MKKQTYPNYVYLSREALRGLACNLRAGENVSVRQSKSGVEIIVERCGQSFTLTLSSLLLVPDVREQVLRFLASVRERTEKQQMSLAQAIGAMPHAVAWHVASHIVGALWIADADDSGMGLYWFPDGSSLRLPRGPTPSP